MQKSPIQQTSATHVLSVSLSACDVTPLVSVSRQTDMRRKRGKDVSQKERDRHATRDLLYAIREGPLVYDTRPLVSHACLTHLRNKRCDGLVLHVCLSLSVTRPFPCVSLSLSLTPASPPRLPSPTSFVCPAPLLSFSCVSLAAARLLSASL